MFRDLVHCGIETLKYHSTTYWSTSLFLRDVFLYQFRKEQNRKIKSKPHAKACTSPDALKKKVMQRNWDITSCFFLIMATRIFPLHPWKGSDRSTEHVKVKINTPNIHVPQNWRVNDLKLPNFTILVALVQCFLQSFKAGYGFLRFWQPCVHY